MIKDKEVKDLDPKLKEKSYNPSTEDEKTLKFVDGRVRTMKEARKKVQGKDIEVSWKDADKSYIPKDTTATAGKMRLESDDELGLRSHLVPVGDATQDWRSNNSEPTLLVKIHSALSIIIDRDPEAFFQAITKKYDNTTKLAHSLWEASWSMDKSKQQLKLFVFNLAKYGWAVARTYPRIIKRQKKVLIEFDTENPENNKYETKTITDYNGVHRENLDPYKTWIDEMSRPNDMLSTNDWYFEKDYNYDSATLEFGNYKNWDKVSRNSKKQDETETGENQDDIVTIGFYENKNKDLYAITVPSQDILLSSSPLPNDDGMLSVWYTSWILRDARVPYGLGLWDIIKQKKALYDKMSNMTMDQLVLSIVKMGFNSGTSTLINDGKIRVEPGMIKQNLGGKIDWMEVPGPGKDSWDGIKFLKSGIDDDSGITPALEGEQSSSKTTLGEVLNAKESALKRMNVPINNIADALEQEAFISLSWLSQTLSTPEVKEFSNIDDMLKYEKETDINRFDMIIDEKGGVKASFLPQVALKLDKDKEDNLIESKEEQFFQVGKDIMPDQLKWEGIIKVLPRSILSPSVELEKQRKSEVFNIIAPLLQMPPEIYAKPVKQMLKINEEDLEDWLPDTWIQFLETGKAPQPQMPLFQQQGGEETMKGEQGMNPQQSQTVVPRGQVSSSQGDEMGKLGQGLKGMLK